VNVPKLTCSGRTLEVEFETPLKVVRLFREIRYLLFFYCIIVQAASVSKTIHVKICRIIPRVFLYGVKYFYSNRMTYIKMFNEVFRIFLLKKLNSEEFENFLYLNFVRVTLIPMPRARRLFIYFFSAVNRCIMVEELHYGSYAKESKFLSDSR